MDSPLKPCSWDEIHGFSSLGEFNRFVEFIEEQVRKNEAAEVSVEPNYGAGEIFGGRWFKDRDSGQVWRLVPPDFPFKGLWERVHR
ncbi:MAG: hypothetical protein EKK47_22645 [Burkholderiales bacterium]|nr:MAG: hypothetical protein EKK47_22645 [Burkholderiales bacterium]